MILVIEKIGVRLSCSSEIEKRKTYVLFISAFYSDLTALTIGIRVGHLIYWCDLEG